MTIFRMLFLLLGFNALQAKNQPNIMVFLVDDMGVTNVSVAKSHPFFQM
ncbi:hypothetical protein OAL83_01845 [bacterium]|nr:hypothetical protein [bacterium]